MTTLPTTGTDTFTYDDTIVTVTVGTSGYYDITADGAAGGGANTTSGVGAMATGDIYLLAGATLEIVVGGAGSSVSGDGGGGGGSFVFGTKTSSGSGGVDGVQVKPFGSVPDVLKVISAFQ